MVDCKLFNRDNPNNLSKHAMVCQLSIINECVGCNKIFTTIKPVNLANNGNFYYIFTDAFSERYHLRLIFGG